MEKLNNIFFLLELGNLSPISSKIHANTALTLNWAQHYEIYNEVIYNSDHLSKTRQWQFFSLGVVRTLRVGCERILSEKH